MARLIQPEDQAFRMPRIENEEKHTTPTVTTEYAFTDKITNNLPKLIIDERFIIDVTGRRDKRRTVETPVILSYDPAKEGIQIESRGNPLDREDVVLLNAILTLWENQRMQCGREYVEVAVTLQSLYQRITHNSNSRLSEKKRTEYINRLIQLDSLRILINIKSEVDANYGDFGSEKETLYGSIVNIAIHPGYINGNYVKEAVFIYGFNHSPIYQYAKAKGEISSVKHEYLSARAVNKNRENILIEQYLRRRIEGRKSMGNIILVNSIFDGADIDLTAFRDKKDKRKKVLRNVEKIMNGFVSTGYISSWSFRSRGRIRKHSIEFLS